MKSLFCFLITLWGSLALVASAQAQTLKIPAFARPQITAPQINLPASRPRITTPTLSSPNLTPQNTLNFPTVNTPVSVPSFPNVNTVGARLIQSPQTINFPSQTLPTNASGTTTQFFPASITPPNNLNSTLPNNVIVPTLPNLGETFNKLQLVPTIVSFPKTLITTDVIPDPLPNVSNNLSRLPNSQVGVELQLVTSTETFPVRTNFSLPTNFENIGGTLTLD